MVFIQNLSKILNLNRIIEKAVKKYTRDVKLKIFQKLIIFIMEENSENKIEFSEKKKNFYNHQKKKIIILIFILLVALISTILIHHNHAKKNILISEKYVQAGLYLSAGNKDSAKSIYEEIILTKNNLYSLLSLNTIIEKNLISDKNQILEYFEILENSSLSQENKDLLTLKKGLYLIKNSNLEDGYNSLKKLIKKDSNLSSIVEQLIKK